MSSLNSITLIGRLGRDPELRTTPGGMSVCEISIATSERRKDGSDQYVDEVQWHNVTFWDKKAEIAAQYLQKGSLVCVQGSLKYNKYTDNSGVNRIKTFISATNLTMLSPKSEHEQQSSAANNSGSFASNSAPPTQKTAAAQNAYAQAKAGTARPSSPPPPPANAGVGGMSDDIPF